MMFRRTRGQTVAEYAVLLSLVVAAAVAMQIYVRRGLQARMKKGTDAFTGVTATMAGYDAAGTSATFASQDQYEPYYQEQFNERYQENIEQEHMGGGKVIKEKVSDVSATKAGGFEEQVAGDKTRQIRDAQWTTP